MFSVRRHSLRRSACRLAVMIVATGFFGHFVSAASPVSYTWTGNTNALWATAGNWTPVGGPPGEIDSATFNTNPANGTTTTLSLGTTGAAVTNITFDTSSAGAFTIGTTSGGTLTLASGGITQIKSGVTQAETINAPISIDADTPSYTFTNNSTTTTATLTLGGEISSTANGSHRTTINLDGSNTGNNTISGKIDDNNGTAITKSGAGTWILTNTSNAFTKGITMNAGTLAFSSGASGSGTIDFGGNSTLRWNGTNTQDLSGRIKIEDGITASIDTNGNNVTFATALQVGSSKTGGLTKTGNGTLTLSGSNTFTGATTINGGTLSAGAGGLGNGASIGTTQINVNSGGTLLLTGSGDHIRDTAAISLNGGTFNTGGVNEVNGAAGSRTPGMGALTLTANSAIDFGTGASVIEFNGLGTHTANTLLTITNWTGTPNVQGGTDQLLFAGTKTSFTSLYNQNDVSFDGVTGYNIFQITANYYEVTEAPEPSTWLAASLTLFFIGYTQRRKLVPALKRFAALPPS